MKIKTKWRRNSNSWYLSPEINVDGAIIYAYLANIETIFEEGILGKKVYIVTDLFGEYYPDPCGYFWDKKFDKLKEAKAWAEKEVAKSLGEMSKQVKGLGKGK